MDDGLDIIELDIDLFSRELLALASTPDLPEPLLKRTLEAAFENEHFGYQEGPVQPVSHLVP